MKRHAKKTRALYAQKNNMSFIKYIRSSRRGGKIELFIGIKFSSGFIIIFRSNVSYLYKYMYAHDSI